MSASRIPMEGWHMAAERTAHVTWKGDLFGGSGEITKSSSGTLDNFPVTWASRTELPGGKTSPEELIAAAHASCFSMAFSAALAGGGNQPTQLDVEVTYTFSLEGGAHISKAVINVTGQVEGMDQAAFEEAAKGAGEGCPVSKAVAGNVPLTVNATLAS